MVGWLIWLPGLLGWFCFLFSAPSLIARFFAGVPLVAFFFVLQPARNVIVEHKHIYRYRAAWCRGAIGLRGLFITFFFFTVALYFYFWLPHFFLVPSGRVSAKLCRSVPGMGVNESVGPGWLRSCALCAVRCSSLVKLPRLTQKADGCGGQASTGEIYNLSFPGTRKIGFYGKRMNITKKQKSSAFPASGFVSGKECMAMILRYAEYAQFRGNL